MTPHLSSNLDKYFDVYSDGPHAGKWRCTLCHSRPFIDRLTHCKVRSHIDRHLLEVGSTPSASRAPLPPPGLLPNSHGPFTFDALELYNEMGLSDDEMDVDHLSSGMGCIGRNDLDEQDDGSSEDSHTLTLENYLATLTPAEGNLDEIGAGDDIFDLDARLNRQWDQGSQVSSSSSDNEEPASLPSSNQSSQSFERDFDWYPFAKAEQVAGLLIMGTDRNRISIAEYNRIRCILKSTLNVHLPDAGHLKATREKLKERLGFGMGERQSVLGTPCFSLRIQDILAQNLSNPLIAPHIAFLPETDTGVVVDRLAQSKKWREGLSREMRVPMVKVLDEHFYIYEPVELRDSSLVVPAHFYRHKGTIMAKCLKLFLVPNSDESISNSSHLMRVTAEPEFDSPDFLVVDVSNFAKPFSKIVWNDGASLEGAAGKHIWRSVNGENESIDLPNPWRRRANGLEIRHMPITLYSDDTSGLPPKLTHQEFNIHPLATSNTASALELAEQIVDELNGGTTNGFVAYDVSIRQEVLVIPWVLCHLGDSPMHAEISNTTTPSSTLNPCRVCFLSVDTRADKQSEKYIRDFVGIDLEGSPVLCSIRDWNVTKAQTQELWRIVRQPNSIKLFDDKSKSYGVRDTLNHHFCNEIRDIHRENRKKAPQDRISPVEIIRKCENMEEKYGDRLFNPFLKLIGFNGHIDTPVESLHVVLLGVAKYLYRDAISGLTPAQRVDVIGRWQSFKADGLNIPKVQPNNLVQYCQSLLGKDFRVVLQGAPFVLFEHLSEEHRHLWSLLGHLASYIFQTKIFDKEQYLAELKVLVDRFINQLISINAQWTNKPKFHMLNHLSLSIERFGPAALVATEKEEGYNGVTRIASGHSNRHAPGRDISRSFNDSNFTETLLTGATFYDQKLHIRTRAGPKLRGLFEHKEIQKGIGWNAEWNHEDCVVVKLKSNSKKNNEESPIPLDLKQKWPQGVFVEVASISFTTSQSFRNGQFVLVRSKRFEDHQHLVGKVTSMWQGRLGGHQRERTCVKIALCQPVRGLHPFYGMKEMSITDIQCWIKPEDVLCVLNVQHNCKDGGCRVGLTRRSTVERTLTQHHLPEVTHQNNNSYLLNAAAMYSSEYHRVMTGHHWSPVTPEEWNESVKKGLAVWLSKCPPKHNHQQQ